LFSNKNGAKTREKKKNPGSEKYYFLKIKSKIITIKNDRKENTNDITHQGTKEVSKTRNDDDDDRSKELCVHCDFLKLESDRKENKRQINKSLNGIFFLPISRHRESHSSLISMLLISRIKRIFFKKKTKMKKATVFIFP